MRSSPSTVSQNATRYTSKSRRLAHENGGTLSAVVREAVAEYGAAREKEPTGAGAQFLEMALEIGQVAGEPTAQIRFREVSAAVTSW